MKVIKMKRSDASEQAELTKKLRKASDAYYEGGADHGEPGVRQAPG